MGRRVRKAPPEQVGLVLGIASRILEKNVPFKPERENSHA
jgi:hypothetical protein